MHLVVWSGAAWVPWGQPPRSRWPLGCCCAARIRLGRFPLAWCWQMRRRLRRHRKLSCSASWSSLRGWRSTVLILASLDNRHWWLVVMIVTALVLAGALRAQELPLGFLDYLGGMVEQDGELLDPLMLDDAQQEVPEEMELQPVELESPADPEVVP